MSKAPLAQVKQRFESKEKLLAALQRLTTTDLWIDRVNGIKGLARVSNAKLIRLHDQLADVKARFGTRDKLVGAILELAKRSKDKGYATRLGAFPLPRLLDLHRTLTRAAKRAAAAPAAPPKPAKKAMVKKPVASQAAKQAKSEAKVEPKAKPEAKAEAKSEAKPKAEPKAKADAKPKAEKAPAKKAPAKKA